MSKEQPKPRYKCEFVTFGESYLRFHESNFPTYKGFCEHHYVKMHTQKDMNGIYIFISKLS